MQKRATQRDRAAFRADWSHGQRVLERGVRCDHCDKPAIAAATNGQFARWLCADGFREHMAEQRLTRPSREDLIARVNAAIGA